MRINGAPYLVDLSRPDAVRQEKVAAQAPQESAAPQKARSFDRVEISPQSREVERLKRELAALPDVRLDRVALAKQKLQEGSYSAAPTVLAQKIMEAYGIK
jgi:negative regulator of flagellin synthesis FlgM